MTAARPLRLLLEGEQPSVMTLRCLYEMRIKLERHQAAGSWDSWDGRLIDKWLAEVTATIHDAELALIIRIDRLEER